MLKSAMKRLSFIVVAALTACAGQVEEEQAEALPIQEVLAGCYGLTVDNQEWRLPARIELDTARMTEWPALTSVYPDVFQAWSMITPQAARDNIPFAYWRPAGGDSILVAHPMAMAGVELHLVRSDDGVLEGMALSYTDVLVEGRPTRDSTAARAERVPCREE